jgi:hypothetical protein
MRMTDEAFRAAGYFDARDPTEQRLATPEEA